MKIIGLDSVRKGRIKMEGAKDVFKQVPVSKNDGAPLFSFRVFTIEPEGHTPFHQHPFEHVNYVIEGAGAIVSQDGREHEIKKGDFALVLPNEKHQYRNKSAGGALILICAVQKEYE